MCVALPCCGAPSRFNVERWWLWVPACAGTTTNPVATVFKQPKAFSRHGSPEFCKFIGPLSKQRAQGKPGAGCTRRSRALEHTGIPCTEAHGQGLQVQPRHPGFPRAMALRLIGALPGERRLLSPLPAPKTAGPDRRHGRGARTTRFRRPPWTFRRMKDHLTPQRPIATRAYVSWRS